MSALGQVRFEVLTVTSWLHPSYNKMMLLLREIERERVSDKIQARRLG